MIIQYIEWPKDTAPTYDTVLVNEFNSETYFWIGIREIPSFIECNYRRSECEWIVPGTVEE